MGKTRSNTPKAPRITIDVTGEIIRDSKERDSSHCMIAEAVKAAYPDAKRVSVDVQTIRFTDVVRGLRFVYLTPRKAQVAIVNFDRGILPDPFRFNIYGGQVSIAGTKPPTRTASEKQKAVLDAARAARNQNLKKARLVQRQAPNTPEGDHYVSIVPDRVGGRTPPLSIGLRREFGIRAFDQIR